MNQQNFATQTEMAVEYAWVCAQVLSSTGGALRSEPWFAHRITGRHRRRRSSCAKIELKSQITLECALSRSPTALMEQWILIVQPEVSIREGVGRGQLDARIHHVGFVVSGIKRVIEGFVRSLGATWEGKVFHDPLQKVRVTFLRTACSTDPLIELVEPAGEDSPVRPFLEKGGGLHHLCYEVHDLDAHLREMRTRGGIIVKPPLPAVAFGNRRIAWVCTQQKLLLEFLEQKKGEVPLG